MLCHVTLAILQVQLRGRELLTDFTGEVDITCVWKLNGLLVWVWPSGGFDGLSTAIVDRPALSGDSIEGSRNVEWRSAGRCEQCVSVSSTTNAGSEVSEG